MNDLPDEIRIERGVREGCVASPTIFNLYAENILFNMKGVKLEANITTILDMQMTQHH